MNFIYFLEKQSQILANVGHDAGTGPERYKHASAHVIPVWFIVAVPLHIFGKVFEEKHIANIQEYPAAHAVERALDEKKRLTVWIQRGRNDDTDGDAYRGSDGEDECEDKLLKVRG